MNEESVKNLMKGKKTQKNNWIRKKRKLKSIELELFKYRGSTNYRTHIESTWDTGNMDRVGHRR